MKSRLFSSKPARHIPAQHCGNPASVGMRGCEDAKTVASSPLRLSKPGTKFCRRVFGMLALVALLSPLAPRDAALAGTPASTNNLCDTSPFGHVLVLGNENEVFMGFKNADVPNPGSLGSYRFDLNPSTGYLHERALVLDADGGRNNISAWVSTTADLDGDGKAEFVQGFTDANGQYQIVVNKNGSAVQSHVESWPNHTYRAMAA